jgi:hypothetical protein
METVIASYRYRFRHKGNVITFYSYVSGDMAEEKTCNVVTF